MAITQAQTWLFDSFFEARFHAYVEMSYYFMAFMVLNLTLSLWSFFWINDSDVAALPAAEQETCGMLNIFFHAICILALVEIIVSACVAVSIGHIMRKGCAYFGLLSLLLFGLVLTAKAGVLLMGAMWLFNEPSLICQTAVPQLYLHAEDFLIVCASLYAFQLVCGSFILSSLGMGQAIKEGLWRIREQGKSSEDADDERYEANEETTSNKPLLKQNGQSDDVGAMAV